MSAILKLDLEPLQLNPSISKDNGYKTYLSAFSTLLITILSLLAIFAFGSEIVFKKNPIVAISEYYNEYPIIQSNKIALAFTALHKKTCKIEEFDKYLEFTFISTDTDGKRITNPSISTKFDIIPCNETSLFKDNKFDIQSNLIAGKETYYCPPETRNSTLPNLENQIGRSTFKRWSLSLSICQNKTENNFHCKSKEEIQAILGTFYVHAIITDNFINSNDLENPIQNTYFEKLFRVSSKDKLR